MISIDVLREFRPAITYKDGASVSLSSVRDAIKECAQSKLIPLEFYDEKVKSGGFFNTSVEDCIIICHPEHQNDYIKFCIRVKHQGSYASISVNDFGFSKQLEKEARAEFAKQDRVGKTMSYKVGSMIGSGIMNIGMNKQKLEDEKMYYQCIADIIDEVFSEK